MDDKENLPIDYTFLPYTELMNLSQEKDSLKEELSKMQTQFAELMQQQKNENKDESSKNSEQQVPSATFEKEEPSEFTERKEKIKMMIVRTSM